MFGILVADENSRLDRERIEKIVGEQSTAQRLLPLKIIYLVLSSGVVMFFALRTFFGIQNQGDTLSPLALNLAAALLNTANYLPTADRVRWWRLNGGV